MQPSRDETTRRRSTGIDLFRGFLVLAVILGHFSELTQRDSFFTWVGLGFRMPLFIGLTGYLFNLERARESGISALLRKYYPRLLLPWLIACLVHLILINELHYLSPLQIFVRPPFHLWFVPVMLAFILAATVSRLSAPMILAVSIPVSIGSMYGLGVVHIGAYPWWAPDHRFFIYPIFFAFGMWVARRPYERWKEPVALTLAAIGFLWWCLLYEGGTPAAEVAAELILCLPLIALLPLLRHASLNFPPLVGIGRDSLFYYLWHPLAFGVWAACGFTGVSMLVLSLLLMFVVRGMLATAPGLAGLLGVLPRPVLAAMSAQGTARPEVPERMP